MKMKLSEITNEKLSRLYVKDKNAFYHFGRMVDRIAERIKECEVAFCDYYMRHGNLRDLVKRRATEGIGPGAFCDLEFILERLTGKPIVKTAKGRVAWETPKIYLASFRSHRTGNAYS